MASREPAFHANTTIHRSTRFTLALAAGVVALAVALWSGLAERAGLALYDAQTRWQLAGGGARAGETGHGAPPLALVAIDQTSLDWVQKELGLGWPWPRELYGVMAGYLRGARAQAWDILFTETSTYGPEDDARCAAAMSEAGNVALATLVDKAPVFGAAKLALGHVAADVDPDGICRKYRVWIDRAGEKLPALGLAALEVAARDRVSVGNTVRAPDAGSAIKLSGAPSGDAPGGNAAGFSMPVSGASAEKLLKFWPRSAFVRYSAAQIIAAAMRGSGPDAGAAPGLESGTSAPAPAPIDLNGKFVVVGIIAPGLMDRQATPIDPALPGMEVHATFIADALAGNFMSRAPWWIELLAALAVAALISAFPLIRKRGVAAAGVALALAAPLAASMLLFPHSIFFNPISATIASLASFVAAIGLGYRAEGRQRAYLRRAFAQYLSPEVISTLVEAPEKLRLGGESRVISVLFSDLEGFTSISERLGPEQLARFMNEYLGIISAEILDQGGTLDKYVGDAVVAFWNAPLNIRDHAIRALAAATHIQRQLAEAGPGFVARYGMAPHTRIGVATGPAVVGNLGSSLRFAYTAVGDSVNVASRLEAANKATGTLVLTMGETVAVAISSMLSGSRALPPAFNLQLSNGESIALKQLGPALMQGKTLPVELWTIEFDASVLGAEGGGPDPWEDLRTISK